MEFGPNGLKDYVLRVYGRLAKSRNVEDFMWETWTKNSNRNINLSPISSPYIPENIRNNMSFALAGSLLFLSLSSHVRSSYYAGDDAAHASNPFRPQQWTMTSRLPYPCSRKPFNWQKTCSRGFHGLALIQPGHMEKQQP